MMSIGSCKRMGGGQRDKWSKRRGTTRIDDLGMSRPCEVHWHEEESVGRVEMKVKKYYYG